MEAVQKNVQIFWVIDEATQNWNNQQKEKRENVYFRQLKIDILNHSAKLVFGILELGQ